MARREPDSYREQKEGRRRAYLAARTLRELFPAVEEVQLHMTFVDPHNASQHSPQVHSFLPGARAFFEVACPFSMCIGGGFDLRRIVADLTARNGEIASGKLTCQGWHSRDRLGASDRCLLQLHYRLTVRYKE
jgi:hypothetical protein